jgi:hypothetical protein
MPPRPLKLNPDPNSVEVPTLNEEPHYDARDQVTHSDDESLRGRCLAAHHAGTDTATIAERFSVPAKTVTGWIAAETRLG